MEYAEKALTIQEQVQLLAAKGLGTGGERLAECLSNVSYHRLGGYWRPFREADGKGDWRFRAGTDIAEVWDRYVFDRQLRLLVFDAIERVEVALRNDLVLHLAVSQGPFGYLDPLSLPGIEVADNFGRVVYTHKDLLARARTLFRRELDNGNAAVRSFKAAHGDAHREYLPYWMLVESVEFGTLCRLLTGAPVGVRKTIAQRYGLKSPAILSSWASTFRSARNRCGHHGIFWDRRYRVKPVLPNKKSPEWHEPVDVEKVKDTAFGTLTMLRYMLGYIAPQSRWASRLDALFAEHPGIDRRLLGYPENWLECPIWAD